MNVEIILSTFTRRTNICSHGTKKLHTTNKYLYLRNKSLYQINNSLYSNIVQIIQLIGFSIKKSHKKSVKNSQKKKKSFGRSQTVKKSSSSVVSASCDSTERIRGVASRRLLSGHPDLSHARGAVLLQLNF